MPARRCRASTSWSKSTRCSSNWCRCWTRSTRPKLNESLGALAKAFSGRGAQLGQSLSDLDSFLAKLEPSLPALSHDLAVLPAVSNAYADAAPDLVRTAANATRISKTIVDEQHNLDALLISAIGLADIGNDVLSTNRQPLTNVLHLLVPTTDLTNEYHEALTCGFRRAHTDSARSAVVGTEHQHIGESHLGRRTLSVPDEPAQGRGDGRPAVPGSAAAAVQHASAATDYRYRCQPGGVRKPAAADQLRSPQTAVVRADRRPTAQLRSDRTTRMRTRATLIKFAIFAVVMAMLTAFLFFIFGQYRTGSTTGYSAVFTDVSRLKVGADGAGRRDPGGHGQQRFAAAGQKGCGEVRRRPQRRPHRGHQGGGPLPQPGGRSLPRTHRRSGLDQASAGRRSDSRRPHRAGA